MKAKWISPILALAACYGSASAITYQFNIMDLTKFSHEIGSALGSDTWRAYYTPNPVSRKFSTSGPYTSDLQAGDNIAATRFFLWPDDNRTLKFTWDVYDQNQGGVIASKDVSLTSTGHYTNQMMQVTQAFTVNASHRVQFRTGHWGTGTLDQCSSIQVMGAAQVDWTIPATYAKNHHEVGSPVGQDWMVDDTQYPCSYGLCSGKFMTYGPYENLVYGGPTALYALFKMSISYVGNSDAVATIDVMALQGTTYKILASKSVLRSEFRGAYVMTPIPLRFDYLPNTYSNFQFRVRYIGPGILQQDPTRIYRPVFSTCLY
jgi:hypothetical protein